MTTRKRLPRAPSQRTVDAALELDADERCARYFLVRIVADDDGTFTSRTPIAQTDDVLRKVRLWGVDEADDLPAPVRGRIVALWAFLCGRALDMAPTDVRVGADLQSVKPGDFARLELAEGPRSFLYGPECRGFPPGVAALTLDIVAPGAGADGGVRITGVTSGSAVE